MNCRKSLAGKPRPLKIICKILLGGYDKFMQSHQLKLAGLVAGVIVVVGILSLLVFAPAGIGGISAYIGEKQPPAGYAWITKSDWQEALAKLKSYPQANETTREQIIQEVFQILDSAQAN